MSLETKFWKVDPAPDGNQYTANPTGALPGNVAWSQVPNIQNATGALSVNIITSYLQFTGAAPTVTLIGTLPAGWAFDGTHLTYDGVGIGTSGQLKFAAQQGSAAPVNSNQFTVQGAGAGAADNTPATIPLGLTAVSVTPAQAITQSFPSSDANPPGKTWNGLGPYDVLRTPPGSVIGTIPSAAGLKAVWALADIAPGLVASTLSQNGADLTISTQNVDPSYPSSDGVGGAHFSLSGQQWVLSARVDNFVAADPSANITLQARTSLAPNSAYVATLLTAFANGRILSEARPSTGGAAVVVQSVNNTTSPAELFLVRNGDTYSYFYSIDGSLTPLGTQTQAMGNTLEIVVGGNTSNGVRITFTVKDVNLQTLANPQYVDNTVTPGTYQYQYRASDKAVPPNKSAYSSPLSVTVPTVGGIDAQTQALLTYMNGLAGKGVLSGQYADYLVPGMMDQVPQIVAATGKNPAILGTFMCLEGASSLVDCVTLTNQWLTKGGIVITMLSPGNPTWAATPGGAPILASDGTGGPTSKPGNPGGHPINFNQIVVPGSPENLVWLPFLDQLVAKFNAITGPVIVRPFPELNRSVQWWAQQPPADFIALWKQMVTYIRAAGVKNVLWCINFDGNQPTTAADVANYCPPSMYPYVDIVSIDRYPPQASDAPKIAACVATGKPVIYAEIGAVVGNPLPPKFSGDTSVALQTIITNFPQVVAAVVWAATLALPDQNGMAAFMSNAKIINLEDLQPTSGSFASDPMPASFLIIQGAQNSYNDPTVKANAARFNTVEYDPYLGIESANHWTMAGVMQTVQSLGAAKGLTIRQSNYLVDQTNAATYTAWRNFVATVPDWWLRKGGSTIPDSFGGLNINNSSYIAGVLHSGKTMFQQFSEYFIGVLFKGLAQSVYGESTGYVINPYGKVLFLDNRFCTPRTVAIGADWNRDGTNDPNFSAAVNNALQAGHAMLNIELRKAFPGVLIIGNCDLPGRDDVAIDSSNINPGIYDAVFYEGAIGTGYGREQWGGFNGLMSGMRRTEQTLAAGGVMILNQQGNPTASPSGDLWPSQAGGWSPTNWRGARCGAGMAAQRNWTWSPITQNYSALEILFFDELQQGGKFGWMGLASGSPPETGPRSKGVWWHDLPGGRAYCNPRNNGQQTITVDVPLHRIKSNGFGDSSVNNGAALPTGSQLLLQDGDGLFCTRG